MRYSDNYNLKLPQRGVDRANVDDLDDNFEAIDGALADDRQIGLLMYDSTATYNTGAIRGYENPTTHRIRAYRCLEDGVTGPWDATKWAQTTLAAEIENSGGGGGSSTLAGLSDVDLDTLADGEVLTYDATEGKWVNADPIGGASELSDLDDVSLDTPTEGQILTYDGDEWVNADAPDVDVTKTASGNPIEVSDSASAPLVKCVTQITGSQDLHGYDKPWVGGAGKNKWAAEETFSKDDSATYTPKVFTLAAGTYTISGLFTTTSSDNKVRFSFRTSSPVNVALTANSGSRASATFTLTEQCETVRVYGQDNTSDTYAATYTDVMVESGETATTFEPYSNICPITAYTEGEIEVRGKNLANDTVVNSSRTQYSVVLSAKASLKPSTTYTISFVGTQGNVLYANENVFNNASVTVRSGVTSITVTTRDSIDVTNSSQGENGRWKLLKNSIAQSNDNVFTNVQIEVGSSATDYEEFRGTTHTTTFPSAIYRGSEDVVNGEVTSDKLKMVFDGSSDENWIAEDSFVGRNFYINIADALPIQYADTGLLSNMFEASPLGSMRVNKILISTSKNLNVPVGELLGIDTAADWKTWLSTHNLEVVYNIDLTTSSVTPTNLPIKSLNGYSHIESSTGNMEIEYIVGKYQPIVEVTEREIKTIDEMLTENIESFMVASQNYTTGELIIACGKIYRATSNIASGSNLTVGTNVVKTTIEDEIARSGGGTNYSTTEHIVGTWIDGSTVYEQTFSFSIPSNNYTTETTGITNFDKCIGYSGIVALGNGYFEDINYGRPDSSNSTYYIAITSTGDIFFKTYETSSGTAYITMRYTKSS